MNIAERLERMFSPDVRVRVNANTIESYHALTVAGAEFISRNSLLGMDYDAALSMSNGLCFESIES